MHRTTRAILALVFLGIIMFSAISLCQGLLRRVRVDVTEEKLYTLSPGSKALLAKINQPIKFKLYYTRTAALKGPDQIRFFNNYYYFVRDLLEEYVRAAKGKIEFEQIDPRPFSDEEAQALQAGLKHFPLTKEENFFFGLVLQTEFGVTQTLPFFAPDRQNFIEYDISQLIDNAITRQKSRIGILSSLPVLGDESSPYLQRLMAMQGQRPKPAWAFVRQLQQQYDVSQIEADTQKISDIDILIVLHPKDLSEPTQFAIDQFIVNGGRAIVCLDPHALSDPPDPQSQFGGGPPPQQSSNLPRLLKAWGLEMPELTFSGDRTLALEASMSRTGRPEKTIAFLELTRDCFNPDSVISAELNQVRMLFSGVLNRLEPSREDAEQDEVKLAPPQLEYIPLLQTTNRGNSWDVPNPYALMRIDARQLMGMFSDGEAPVTMAYLVTGKFSSAFPEGVNIPPDPEEPNALPQNRTGLIQATAETTVAVFADVDFISDMVAYRENPFFGTTTVADNSALMLNTIEEISGSSELIAIRSRGGYQRPFVVVDQIEQEAEDRTAAQVEQIQQEIAGIQRELNEIANSARNEDAALIESSFMDKKAELELKVREAQGRLDQVRRQSLEAKEALENKLRNANMFSAPAVILVLVIVLAGRRSLLRRRYISHASDA